MKYQPPSASASPRFAGIKTFMRLPHVKTTEDVDFAIVGIPFDTGCCYKNGARFGPDAIRISSTLMRNYSMNLDINIFDYLSGVDYGDLDITPGYILESYKQIEEGLQPIIDAGVVPFAMGGDHSITLAELRAVAKKHGPVALVHFDSHLDTWDQYWGQKYAHGTPFRRACEEGLIDTEHSIQVGIRGSQYGPEDVQGSIDLGFDVLTANELHKIGIEEGVKRIQKRVGEAKTFLTFDIDFVDPSMAPGTGTIEVGGFDGYETMTLIQGLRDVNLVATDFVEVLPTIDPSGKTAYMCANVMHEVISILALQKKAGKR
ncbi:agmatinase [Clostridium aminobutyricum]|uniref:Agmatinase n=2 Tax=Clostridium aminobutyricum TaxID=33953 RepID=A0A939D8M7_CLOAM|nr:agmatinase [Clostridium aminobutyricum]